MLSNSAIFIILVPRLDRGGGGSFNQKPCDNSPSLLYNLFTAVIRGTTISFGNPSRYGHMVQFRLKSGICDLAYQQNCTFAYNGCCLEEVMRIYDQIWLGWGEGK